MADQYDTWRRRLAGEVIRLDARRPEPGLWRMRLPNNEYLPVRIWEATDPETGEITHKALFRGEPCRLEQVWPACGQFPVSKMAFERYATTGKWIDHVELSEADLDSEDAKVLYGAIGMLEAEVIQWLESIGGTIKTPIEADKCQNYIEGFLSFQKRAEKCQDKERKPHNARLKRIALTWNPVEKRAERQKDSLRLQILKPWLDKKKAEAAEAGVKAPINVGTMGKRAGLRERDVVDVEDFAVFMRFLADRNERHDQLMNALQIVANALLRDLGPTMAIPGLKVSKKESVV